MTRRDLFHAMSRKAQNKAKRIKKLDRRARIARAKARGAIVK